MKIAERFGDMITTDHKVLNEDQVWQIHQTYAVVVQDLATQWIQSYPCKTKSAQETPRRLRKNLIPRRKNPRPILTANTLFFVKLAKSWIGIMRDLRCADPKHLELQNELHDE